MNIWVKILLGLLTFELLLLGNAMCRGATLAEEDIFAYQYWETMRDGSITFCAEGVDPGWVESTIEAGWDIGATYECSEPDLVIVVLETLMHPDVEGHVCGLAHPPEPCRVELNELCMDASRFLIQDVPEKTLLHEVGHCMGLGHRDRGVMTPVVQFYPTEEDKADVHEHYGLNVGVIPAPVPGEWTLSRWASQPTSTDALALDVLAAYNLRDGIWLRYFPDAPAEINTLVELQRDQPIFVLGR